ncbi:pyrroline-5-carboxylate reductase [Niallia sp. Krafla_26]|uniref:pyrroline-5-carboxylate reductase n=1 Tax=Niallia sp. Krafla_26 TaxID=3064703 RepID=UPI003D185154
MKKIAMIGAGSMAEALISGMVKNQLLEPSNIWVTNRSNQEKLQELKNTYGVSTSYQLQELCQDADAIILAMKPKDALNALVTIKDLLQSQTVIISVLAGVSINSIERILTKPMAIVRAMPNTSATIGKSATALACNEHVSTNQSVMVEQIFQTVGLSKFVKEEQLDAVTGLSGSGPAYVYYIFEAMEKSAIELGLEKELVKDLIIQTFLGAAEMLSTTTKSAGQLRKEVTSPGGTTEAGLQTLADHGVEQALISCIKEAAAQSKRLGEAISHEMESKVVKR